MSPQGKHWMCLIAWSLRWYVAAGMTSDRCTLYGLWFDWYAGWLKGISDRDERRAECVTGVLVCPYKVQGQG